MGSRIFDFGHKMLKPSTCACELCSLTHNSFGEKESWKIFKKTTKSILEFYHKDEFEKQFAFEVKKYPLILTLENNQLEIVLDHAQLRGVKSIDELIERLNERENNELL